MSQVRLEGDRLGSGGSRLAHADKSNGTATFPTFLTSIPKFARRPNGPSAYRFALPFAADVRRGPTVRMPHLCWIALPHYLRFVRRLASANRESGIVRLCDRGKV